MLGQQVKQNCMSKSYSNKRKDKNTNQLGLLIPVERPPLIVGEHPERLDTAGFVRRCGSIRVPLSCHTGDESSKESVVSHAPPLVAFLQGSSSDDSHLAEEAALAREAAVNKKKGSHFYQKGSSPSERPSPYCGAYWVLDLHRLFMGPCDLNSSVDETNCCFEDVVAVGTYCSEDTACRNEVTQTNKPKFAHDPTTDGWHVPISCMNRYYWSVAGSDLLRDQSLQRHLCRLSVHAGYLHLKEGTRMRSQSHIGCSAFCDPSHSHSILGLIGFIFSWVWSWGGHPKEG